VTFPATLFREVEANNLQARFLQDEMSAFALASIQQTTAHRGGIDSQ
jgi:hypothetical protein